MTLSSNLLMTAGMPAGTVKDNCEYANIDKAYIVYVWEHKNQQAIQRRNNIIDQIIVTAQD